MPFCEFSIDAGMYDTTSLDNFFIMENLPLANETCLKVYIYARMLCLHPEMGKFEDMLRALGITEDIAMNSFAYWERNGLMQRISDNPVKYAFLPTRDTKKNDMDRDYYKYRDFYEEMRNLFSLDMPVHASQLTQANDWINTLGFSQEGVILLLKHEIARTKSKKPNPISIYKAADRVAQKLAEAGITNSQDIEKEFSKDSQSENLAKELVRRLGMRRKPTEPEITISTKWLNEWGYKPEEVLNACEDTVKAQNPSFGYIDAILNSRRNDSGSFEAMKAVFSRLGSRIMPTPEQCAWYDERLKEGFEPRTIELAAIQQARKNNSTFEGLNTLIGLWRERNLFSRSEAEEYVMKNRALFTEFVEMLREIGTEDRPSADDINAFGTWKAEFSSEVIELCVQKARGKSRPIAYIKSLIEKLRTAGIADYGRANEFFTTEPQKKSTYAKPINPALDYEQRDYTGENFEDDYFEQAVKKLRKEGKV